MIDYVDYVSTEHDQNLAGTFWKKQAVCAGYARGTGLSFGKAGDYLYLCGRRRQRYSQKAMHGTV